MATFKVAPGLDLAVAAVFVRPAVQEAVDALEDAAKTHAPTCRMWLSMRDERVRHSHIKADGQVIPDNLRFRVPKVDRGDDIGDQRSGYDLARAPRDPDLPIGNRINCRCVDPTLPQPLKDSIHKTPVTVAGTRVHGTVETDFPRAAESEYGGDGDTPALFMTTALREVAARLGQGQRR